MSKKPSGTTSPNVADITISAEDIKSVSKLNPLKLKKLLAEEGALVGVKNTSDQPLIQDWNLDLLPVDVEEDFNKYLQEKYVQYELSEVVKDYRIVAIFHEGRTINFLNSFLTERKYPLLVSRAEGRESLVRPSFVLNAGASVILTRRQADALSKFEKVKKSWTTGEEKKESSWLGFLTMKTITDPKNLMLYDMSFVSTEDVEATVEELKVGREVYSRKNVGTIREEE